MSREDIKLYERIDNHAYDAIVVEGYEGVGKGRLLNKLSERYEVTPYRPDYNMWQKYDLRKQDRWKISGFFWDIYSHFRSQCERLSMPPMLFDRGVVSGIVYNDWNIVEDYKSLLGDAEVLHVLVVCPLYRDYEKFQRARNPLVTREEVESQWLEYLAYTHQYIVALETAGVNYCIYANYFDDSLDNTTCASCGHYNYGVCRHPDVNDLVDGDSPRCDKATDKEVQDLVEEALGV